jgi:replicative DNA helicase
VKTSLDLQASCAHASDALRRLDIETHTARTRVVPTGFDTLDRAIGGLYAQDLVILGGRPGIGKTVTALQWARAAAASGVGVVYVCYEHDQLDLLSRLLCLEIGMLDLPMPASEFTEWLQVLHEVRSGRWSALSNAGRHPVVRAARAQLESYADRLYLVAGDTAITAHEVGELLHDQIPDTGLVIVDYMQRMPTVTSTAAQELKTLALAHSVPVVALSSLTEPGMSARRARLHDLRDADVTGYEADVVVLLNEKVNAVSPVHLGYEETNIERYRRFTVFTVEKNRHGAAPVHLEFEKDFTTGRFLRTGGHVIERLVDEIHLT